jgi:DinB superfamily
MAVGAALAFAAANVRAQETTQADKDKALAYLESTKKGVLDATKGLSEAQWNFKAAPDKWSVAECVEHIAAAEDFIRGMAVDKVMKAPAAPDRDTAKIDAGIMAMIPDRSQKAQAPDALKPTNRFGSPEGSLKHFVESRTTTENFLKDTPDLRAHAVDSPLGGPKLDAYEWVLFVSAHSQRHTKQIEEVKANENFPKK